LLLQGLELPDDETHRWLNLQDHCMTSPDSGQPNDPERDQMIDKYYREHARELWALFYSMCSDADRAYDAVQEAFLRYYDYGGEPVRDLRAWLLRVGQNWLRDVARKKSSSCRLLPGLDDMTGRRESAEDLLVLSERQQQIRKAMQELNEDDRKVLVMKYSMDWSAAQMATVMDCSPAAVDMRLSRARRRLADILVEQGFEYE
jgi:RNA polymerase sigma-70 factor (ECF subfamily)